MRILSLTVLLAATACAPLSDTTDVGSSADPAADGVRDLTDMEFAEPNSAADEVMDEPTAVDAQVTLLGRVGVSEDEYVEFFVTDEEPDDIGIGVMSMFPNPPMVTDAFVDAHHPVEVFLAIAPLHMEVPATLLDLADDIDVDDLGLRQQLQADNLAQVRALPPIVDDGEQFLAGSCTTSFKNWVAAVYGEEGTCGKGYTLANKYTSESYCAVGSCDYKLAAGGKAACADSVLNLELESCNRLTGSLKTSRYRSNEFKGNNWHQSNGHRGHFGAANCAGNGSIKFTWKRGGAVSSKFVPVGGMWDVKKGSGVSRPTYSWAYGNWNDDTPQSGSTYVVNRAEVTLNSGSNDRSLLCGEIQKRNYISNSSPGSCNGASASLCYGSGDCDNACFNL